MTCTPIAQPAAQEALSPMFEPENVTVDIRIGRSQHLAFVKADPVAMANYLAEQNEEFRKDFAQAYALYPEPTEPSEGAATSLQLSAFNAPLEPKEEDQMNRIFIDMTDGEPTIHADEDIVVTWAELTRRGENYLISIRNKEISVGTYDKVLKERQEQAIRYENSATEDERWTTYRENVGYADGDLHSGYAKTFEDVRHFLAEAGEGRPYVKKTAEQIWDELFSEDYGPRLTVV